MFGSKMAISGSNWQFLAKNAIFCHFSGSIFYWHLTFYHFNGPSSKMSIIGEPFLLTFCLFGHWTAKMSITDILVLFSVLHQIWAIDGAKKAKNSPKNQNNDWICQNICIKSLKIVTGLELRKYSPKKSASKYTKKVNFGSSLCDFCRK